MRVKRKAREENIRELPLWLRFCHLPTNIVKFTTVQLLTQIIIGQNYRSQSYLKNKMSKAELKMARILGFHACRFYAQLLSCSFFDSLLFPIDTYRKPTWKNVPFFANFSFDYETIVKHPYCDGSFSAQLWYGVDTGDIIWSLSHRD
jgi:hypothetical protein